MWSVSKPNVCLVVTTYSNQMSRQIKAWPGWLVDRQTWKICFNVKVLIVKLTLITLSQTFQPPLPALVIFSQ